MYVHDVLEHQVPALEHPARYLVLPCGRRWGKDRFALHAALLGRGPAPGAFPGVFDGWDVVWLTRDFPQALAIWTEEIRPRFGDTPLIRLNENERSVAFGDGGTLWVKSAENVTSIRGLGKRLKAVVINEAAFFDLKDAWQRVIRPLLVDNAGWAIIMSTTNAGHDGNPEKLTPSYFNRLCEEIEAGARSDEWGLVEGTAFDNVALDPDEVRKWVAEYAPDSVALQEEVYAKRLAGRHGTAFPEWRPALHVVSSLTIPRHWRWAAGLDWGYRAPGAFVLFASSSEGDAVGVDELYFNDGPPESKLHAYDAGHAVGLLCRQYPTPEYIAADEQMWYQTGSSGQTLAEEFAAGLAAAYGGGAAPALVEAVHGPGSRAVKMQLLHRMLSWQAIRPGEKGYEAATKQRGAQRFEGGIVPAWSRPRLRFTDLCRACVRTIPRLVYDPKAKKEDVDTTQEDHAYDAVCAYLMSRVPRAETPERGFQEDRHPGWRAGGRRRHPEREERDEHQPKPWQVGRFRLPRNVEPLD